MPLIQFKAANGNDYTTVDPSHPLPILTDQAINDNLIDIAATITDTNTALTVNGAIIKGRLVTAETSFLIAGGATSYTAKDVIADATPNYLTFASLASSTGGTGYITKARCMSDFLNFSTYSAVIKLHLFHTAPSAIADNSPYTMLWVNRDKRIGTITFPAMATEGGSSTACSSRISTDIIPYKTVGSSSIYAMVELDSFSAGLTTITAATYSLYFELTADNY